MVQGRLAEAVLSAEETARMEAFTAITSSEKRGDSTSFFPPGTWVHAGDFSIHYGEWPSTRSTVAGGAAGTAPQPQ